jgi:hypothetical protein
MRRLCSKSGPAVSVEQAIEEFNQIANEWGIESEEQLVSVSVMPYTGTIESIAAGGGSEPNTVTVTFVYWADE